MDKISIIVPVYNAATNIKQCIESILGQDYNNFELILVDDGSSDSSGNICEEYAQIDPRVKVLHQKNRGVSKARNAGLDFCSGKYICFVDSDDTIMPNYISNFNCKYDISISSYRIVGRVFRNVICKDLCVNYNAASIYVKNNYYTAPWGKLFNKDIIDKYHIRFPENISFGEDCLFVYEYLLHCQSLSVSKIETYVYDLEDGGLVSNTKSLSELLFFYTHKLIYIEKILFNDVEGYRYEHACLLSILRELVLDRKFMLSEVLKDEEFKNQIYRLSYPYERIIYRLGDGVGAFYLRLIRKFNNKL